MEIVHRPTSEIQPYPRNAKDHPVEQVRKIANSIREFGFNQPIVVDTKDVVIVGHGRLEAAKLLGLETVPVVTVDLSPAKASAYRIADNKLNESMWKQTMLLEELKELDLSGFEIEVTGFDKAFLEPVHLEEEEDKSPSVPKSKTVTCPECEYSWQP